MIIGIDPSLTGCGISDGERHIVISTKSELALAERSSQIMREIREFVESAPMRFRGDDSAIVNGEAVREHMPGPLRFYVEAMAPGVMAGKSNPFDRGWLECDLHRLAHFMGAKVTMVSPGTWLKHAAGRGNFPKEKLSLFCFKKYGIEIDDDRGDNKLEAFCIQRYGAAVVAGEIEHVEIAKRGAGRRKKKVA